MTDPTLTHLYFLLDRSGSMQSIKADIEGGFAAFLEEQRGAGTCRVSLAQFDQHYEVVYSDRDLADVPPLELQPRGSTALLDSMARLITEAGASLAALPEERRPGTVVVAVMTDGLENASREWSHAAIKALVEQQTRDYSWQFQYLGADQDAVEVGGSVGVPAGQSLTYARGKAQDALQVQGRKIRQFRDARSVDPAAAMPAFTDDERRSVT